MDLPDADSLLLAYLDDSVVSVGDVSSRSASLASNSSLASTIDASESLFSPPQLGAVIKAFCLINGLLITLRFPPDDHTNPWMYRDDMGGQSHHRWDLRNTIMLLSRHSTCSNGMKPRPMCRNCVMKSVWRRECCDPENTFFILNIAHPDRCTSVLNDIMLHCERVSDGDALLYVKHVPKAHVMRKRPLDSDARERRTERLRKQVLGSASAQIDANCLSLSRLNESNAFIDEMSDALGLYPVDSTPSEKSGDPAAKNASSPLPLGSVMQHKDPPFEDVPKAEPTAQDDSAFKISDSQTAGAYEALIVHLMEYDSRMHLTITEDQFAAIQRNYPLMFSVNATLVQSHILGHLLHTLGIATEPNLMIKSVLPIWIARARARFSADSNIGIGFFNSPSLDVFLMLRDEPVIPSSISSDRHVISNSPVPSAVQGVDPILVAYFVDAVNDGLVDGNSIIPLACI